MAAAAQSAPSVDSPRRRIGTPRLARPLLAPLVILLLSAAYVVRIRDGMADFEVNYRAGQRVAAGETLYQAADGHYMFKYFPSSALIYLPFAALPLEAAKAVWFVLSLAALAGMFKLAGTLVPHRRSRHVMLISGLILAKYFLHELRLGQINMLVTLVLLAGLLALSRQAGTAAELKGGAFTGAAVALKPYAALFLPYLIVTRRWRAAAAACAALTLALALPAFFYGVQGNLRLLREWGATLSQSTPALLTNNDNVSIAAFFTKWLGDSGRALLPAALVLGALAILTIAVIVRGRNQRQAPVLEGALVLTLIPLVSPLGWDYTFLMALLAVVLLVNHFPVFPRPARLLLAANFTIIALAVYDVMGREAYATFMRWSVTTVNFVVVVIALAYLRFRQAC
jgi:alpha-1,2-mannosyltransferase